MADWVRVCGLAEAPPVGQVREAEAAGHMVCLANVDGELRAIDNRCPHRDGPLGQGWLEGGSVVCPWHSWTFDLKTGEGEFPAKVTLPVYPVRVQDEDVLIQIETPPIG
ncbi:MAG: Rieske 2Fe-2S domain-containing protein [Acidobacteriota bacterium]|nr:Rieske 2Fe-2S domain-containing protein [Acidobacteriota bacterium]